MTTNPSATTSRIISGIAHENWERDEALIVVSANVVRAQSMKNSIENVYRFPVFVFHDLMHAVDAIEDNPGYFSAVILDDRLPSDGKLNWFKQQIEIEDPTIVLQRLSLFEVPQVSGLILRS